MKGASSPCRSLSMGSHSMGSRSMGIFPRSPAMHLMLATRICLGAATRCRSAAGCLQRVLLIGVCFRRCEHRACWWPQGRDQK